MKKSLLAGLMLLSSALLPVQAAETERSQDASLNRYELRALPLGNLFYQLDCLAGQGYCSEANYKALWQSLGWSSADDQAILAWQSLRNRYSRQLQLSQQGEGFALPPRFDGIRLWDKIREASLNASDHQQLALNLALSMRPVDAEQLMQVMASFEPRFMHWWTSKGQSLGEAGATAFADLLRQPQLPSLLEQASHFYKARLSPQTVLNFNFLPQPLAGGNTLNGEQVENQSLIEVRENRPATSNLDVSIHEFCHYLYARASLADEKALTGLFAADGQADAISAFNLLNEGLATAIGNGIFNHRQMAPATFSRYLQTPLSFYNDPYLDVLAKALYPRVEQALGRGETLYDRGFVLDYLRIARQSLGPRLNQPVPLLRTLAAAYSPELAPVLPQLQQRLRIGAVWGANGLDANARSTFEHFTALSGVILLKPGQLAQLDAWQGLLGNDVLAQLRQQTRPSFVFGIHNRPNTWIFVLVAPDPAGFAPLIEKLATRPNLVAGVWP